MTQLTILTASEQRVFDQPPVLNNDERRLYFNVTPDVRLALTRIETPSNKAGFLLQLGYFESMQNWGRQSFRSTQFVAN